MNCFSEGADMISSILSGGEPSEILLNLIVRICYVAPSVFLAFMLKGYARALTADKLGDPTPRSTGMLTLNPVKHFDVFGFLMILVAGFGWSKPIQMNPAYFKKPKRDIAFVALAGPMTNFLLAFAGIFVCGFFAQADYASGGNIVYSIFMNFFSIFSLINIGLGIFCLIPIPPLDGSRIMASFFSTDLMVRYLSMERYYMIFFLIILIDSSTIGLITGAIGGLSKIVLGLYESTSGAAGVALARLIFG